MTDIEKKAILKEAQKLADKTLTIKEFKTIFIKGVKFALDKVDDLIKPGDKVLITSPKTIMERNMSPTWTGSMDKYDNTIQIVSCITTSGNYGCSNGFFFNPNWCKKVTDEPQN